MYFLSSLYLPTLLVLFYFVFFSLSSSFSSPSTPSPSYSFFYCVLFFCSLLFFYLYSRSISLLLSLSSLLYSTLSLFGNAALLLALLFPIYASLLKCPSFFLPFSPALIGPFSSRLLFFSLIVSPLHSLFPYSFVPF